MERSNKFIAPGGVPATEDGGLSNIVSLTPDDAASVVCGIHQSGEREERKVSREQGIVIGD
jgi:hypothetical protein